MGKWQSGFEKHRISREWILAPFFLAVSFSTRMDVIVQHHGRPPPCWNVVNGVKRWHDHDAYYDIVADGKACKCRRREHKVFCGDRMVSERRFDVTGVASVFQLAVCRRLPVGQFPECRLPPGVQLETGLQSCRTALSHLLNRPPREADVVNVGEPFRWSQFACDEAATPYKTMLKQLRLHAKALGGLKHFISFERIWIIRGIAGNGKIAYPKLSHVEYVAIQILGFACLAANAKDISDLNNQKAYNDNIGLQILNYRCGMVWHGTRRDSDRLLTLAGELLVDAFEASKDHEHFFVAAFSPNSDPCLEGRIRILEAYLMSQNSEAGPNGPSLDDVVVRNLGARASTLDVVGEHLRVFRNECVWRWAQERDSPLTFQDANQALNSPHLAAEDEASFERLFNAGKFRSFLLRDMSQVSKEADNAINIYVESLALPPAPNASAAAEEEASSTSSAKRLSSGKA